MTSSHRLPVLALALLAGLALAACDDDPVEPSFPRTGAIVAFAFEGHPADTMRVWVTDPATIHAASRRVATGEGPTIPAGTIVRGAGVDPRYPFHFVPASVQLVDVAMELCDGRPMRTAAEVDEYMRGATGLPNPQNAPWCPWGAYPLWVTMLGLD